MLFSVIMNATTRTGAGVCHQPRCPPSRSPHSPLHTPAVGEPRAEGTVLWWRLRGAPKKVLLASLCAFWAQPCLPGHRDSLHSHSVQTSSKKQSQALSCWRTQGILFTGPSKPPCLWPRWLQECFTSDWVHSSLGLPAHVPGCS